MSSPREEPVLDVQNVDKIQILEAEDENDEISSIQDEEEQEMTDNESDDNKMMKSIKQKFNMQLSKMQEDKVPEEKEKLRAPSHTSFQSDSQFLSDENSESEKE